MEFKKIYLFGCFALCLSNIQAETLQIRQLERSGMIPVRTPILIDTINVKKESFSERTLLNSPLSATRTDWRIENSNQEAFFKIEKPAEGYAFSLYRFNLRNEQYTRTALEVSAPGMFQVFVNGKKVSEKTDIQDSLSNAGKAISQLTFEPGQQEVLIKYLAIANNKGESGFKIDVIPSDTSVQIQSVITEKHPLTIENLMTGQRNSSCQISAKGDYALLSGYSVLKNGKRNAYKKVIRLKEGTTVADLTEKTDLGWLPSSNLLYYTYAGMNGRTLATIDPSTLQETILTENLPEGRFGWTPDEKTLLFSVVEKFPEPRKDVSQILVPDDRQPGWRNRNTLAKYSLETGLFEQMTFGYHSTFIEDIRFDSKKAIVSEYETILTERPFRRSSYYEVDLTSFRVDTIWSKVGFINTAKYSPDGRELLVLGSGESFDGIGLNIKPGQIANMYDVQAYLYNLQEKKVTPISKSFDPSIGSAIWNKVDHQIYFTCTDKDRVNLYTYSPGRNLFKKIPTQVDVVTGISLARKNNMAVYSGNSVSKPDQIYALNLKNEQSNLLDFPQEKQFESYELGVVNDWSFISSDGTTIEGRYYLPPNFDSSKKYPMLVYYYSGTTPTNRSFFHPYSMHLYAAQGYVVYVLQPSGTIGFGQEFAARHVNAWGIQTADDIITGVKKFCQEHQFVNDRKVGCMGASYGGFMTMYLQTRTDIFAAAVSHAGISALSSYWGEGFWGYSYSAAASAHSYPWNNPQLYVEQSPLFHADKINTPLLLLHGTADTNVPVGESIQMFTALKLLGKEVDFIQVEGENHGIAQFDKRLAWKKSIFAFFAKWLKDEPQWWNTLYPELPLE
ncbi:MAG: alpha/beta hydrolase family protein [Bacteroidales bacterium]